MTLAFSPRSLSEAVGLLGEHPQLLPVAGCTDLMALGPEHGATKSAVVDLLRISEIRGIREVDGTLEIGSTTTFAEIRRSKEIQTHVPALAEAAAVIGGWQIQNRATIGGNMANASPAGDSLPVLLALDAQAVVIGPSGPREIPYRDFNVEYRRTALEPGEIIAWVRIPQPPPGAVQAFRKVGTRQALAISKVVVAMCAHLDGRIVADIRLAAGSVAATPVRLSRAEQVLIGRTLAPGVADLAGRAAADEVAPIDDVRSTAMYRRWAVERVVRRLVLSLVGPG
jgi:CO/xanthine dehydrogenase FAD-binding subunit